MANKNLKNNAAHLEKELQWLDSIVNIRVEALIANRQQPSLQRIAPPVLKPPTSIYKQFIESFEINTEERVILLLSLLPSISPYLIDKILVGHGLDNKQIPEIGGIKGSNHGGLIPTAETALFLIAGTSLEHRMHTALYFSPRHKFYTKNILKLEESNVFEPENSGVITLSKDVQYMLTSGTAFQPLFNSSFPAKLISTHYEYADMVLTMDTEMQLDEIKIWLKHKNKLLKEWGFENKIPDGYKCLFYGPPGTGKSMAAALIGKQNHLPVYRIDLSMVISKYIGETEKNLSKVFDAAAHKNWILFFDEADALFGKRSNIQNANDKFANQEVSYLLMRMEEYEGVAILATNFKNNIDKAFLRRFQSIVHFSVPGKEQRLKLWAKAISRKTILAPGVNITALAENFALTGANIINVTRYASIMALKKGNNILTQGNLMDGIKKELAKETSLSGESNS